ncbi:hypothetical protein PQX77_006811 [Marasmius sp. AFHP31]|nr:hypothetical protein PQX77_006811 [Marasmius sp. AFHP31]
MPSTSKKGQSNSGKGKGKGKGKQATAGTKRTADDLCGNISDLSSLPSSPILHTAPGGLPAVEETPKEWPVPEELPVPTVAKEKTAAARASRRLAGVKVPEMDLDASGPQPAAKRKKKRHDPEQVEPPEGNDKSRASTEDTSRTLEDTSGSMNDGTPVEEMEVDIPQAESTRVEEIAGQQEDEDGGKDDEEEGEEEEEDYNSDDEFSVYPKDSKREVEASEAIRRYLAAPSSNRLNSKIRAYIRQHAANCTAAAVTCPDLSKDVLVSREGLLKCLYHTWVDKTSRKTDKSEGRLTGVPYAVVGTGKKKNSKKDLEGDEGKKKRHKNLLDIYSRLELPRVEEGGEQHCHCGCRLEDAIWGLYLWKTGRIAYNGKVQGYGREHITPRQRNFEITRLKEWDIDLDDIWTHVKVNGIQYRERSEEERRLARLNRSESKRKGKGEEKPEDRVEQALDGAELEKLLVLKEE